MEYLRLMSVSSALFISVGCEFADRNPPIAQMTSTSDNLGNCWSDEKHLHSILLRNSSSSEVIIASIETSCGCISVEPSEIAIPANQSKRFVVTVDTTIPYRDLARDISTKLVAIRSNGEVFQSIRLFGKVINAISVSSTHVDLGEFCRSTNESDLPIKHLNVNLNDTQSCLLTGLQYDKSVLDCRIAQNEGGSCFTLQISPAVNLAVGDYKETVLICAICDRTHKEKTRKIEVTWRVLPMTRIVPREIALGTLLDIEKKSEVIEFESQNRIADIALVSRLPRGIELSKMSERPAFRLSVSPEYLDPTVGVTTVRFCVAYTSNGNCDYLTLPILYSVLNHQQAPRGSSTAEK